MRNLKTWLRSLPGVSRFITWLKLNRRTKYPKTAAELKASDIYNRSWYYGIELLPDVITKGQYENTIPMLPRLMLRGCKIGKMDCLDIGCMEGLVPVLMARRGARRIVALDAIDHCVEKIAAVQHYLKVKFEYQSVGLMYGLDKKLQRPCFDLINCSGLLYHVISPFMVLAGVRPLLKRNGLIIVSTNVVFENDFMMDFNSGGRWQIDENTFWYLTIPFLDYLLRYMRLAPIDCLYLPHSNITSHIRYIGDKPSGYLSVVCRAVDAPLAESGDNWMRDSARTSWENVGLINWQRAETNKVSNINYHGNQNCLYFRKDTGSMDLWQAVNEMTPFKTAERLADTHVLKLDDEY